MAVNRELTLDGVLGQNGVVIWRPHLDVHPVAAIFPLLDDAALDDLATDIQANGLIHPIVLDEHGGLLVDGRNRLAACDLVGVEPRFERLPPGTDLVAYIIAANVRRRHLTKGQEAMAIVMADAVFPQGTPVRKLAAGPDIGQTHIHRARTVLTHDPDLADAVMAGGSLNEAYERVLVQKAAAERRAQVAADAVMRQATMALEAEERVLADLAAAEARALADLADVERLREEAGSPVDLPPEPNLAIFEPAMVERATAPTPALTAGLGNLDGERAFLNRIISIKEALQTLAAEPPVPGARAPEMQVMAVRSSVTNIVAAAYKLAESYNAFLADQTNLRLVK